MLLLRLNALNTVFLILCLTGCTHTLHTVIHAESQAEEETIAVATPLMEDKPAREGEHIADKETALMTLGIANELESTDENSMEFKEETSDYCGSQEDSLLKKRVSVLGFGVVSAAQAVDLAPAHQLLPSEIARVLSLKQQILSINSANIQLPSKSHEQGFKIALNDLLHRDNTQYSIIGTIVSTAFGVDTPIFEKLKQKKIPWKQINGQKPRVFAINLTIIDNFSGLEIAQNQFANAAYDHPSLKNKPQAFTDSFYQSEYGSAVKKVIDDASEWIVKSVNCLPNKALITQASSEGVTINLGDDVGIIEGMKFVVSSRGKQSLPDFIQQTDPNAKAEIVITNSYANKAYGRYANSLSNFQVYINDQAELIE